MLQAILPQVSEDWQLFQIVSRSSKKAWKLPLSMPKHFGAPGKINEKKTKNKKKTLKIQAENQEGFAKAESGSSQEL